MFGACWLCGEVQLLVFWIFWLSCRFSFWTEINEGPEASVTFLSRFPSELAVSWWRCRSLSLWSRSKFCHTSTPEINCKHVKPEGLCGHAVMIYRLYMEIKYQSFSSSLCLLWLLFFISIFSFDNKILTNNLVNVAHRLYKTFYL